MKLKNKIEKKTRLLKGWIEKNIHKTLLQWIVFVGVATTI